MHTQTFRLMHTLGVGHGEGGVRQAFLEWMEEENSGHANA